MSKTKEEIREVSEVLLQLLTNEAGAEFEDESLAVDIIAETMDKMANTKEEIKPTTTRSDKYGEIGNCINGTTCKGCVYNNPDDKACVGCSKRIENYEIYISKP